MAQLSPGDLTTAHADLEGMSNCTQCHDLGNKVTNAKCLECHKEIKALITRKEGLSRQQGCEGQGMLRMPQRAPRTEVRHGPFR